MEPMAGCRTLARPHLHVRFDPERIKLGHTDEVTAIARRTLSNGDTANGSVKFGKRCKSLRNFANVKLDGGARAKTHLRKKWGENRPLCLRYRPADRDRFPNAKGSFSLKKLIVKK